MARYTEKIRTALDKINEGTVKRRRVYGILGRVEADGTRTVRVAGDPTKAHVQVQGQQAATTAFHRGAVNLDSGGGQPVIMWREDGQLHIEGYNPLQANEIVTSTVYARSDAGAPGIFDRFSSDTAGVRTVIYLAHITDADMIDHFGASIQMAIEDSAGVRHPVGFISAQRDGADDNGRLVFTPMSAGSPGNSLIIWSDGTVQMQAYGAGVATFDANGLLTSEPAGATDVAAAIWAAAAKTTPVDADVVGLVDTEDANSLKKLSWANIKATLQAAFDSVYAAIGHNHDGVYSLISHNHDGVYSLVGHNHDGVYSLVSHNHAHNSLTDLTTGDAHTQYALLAGRAGGQTLQGGTAGGDDLTLESTSHGTKGTVRLQPSGGDVRIGSTSVASRIAFDGGVSAAAGILYLDGGAVARYAMLIESSIVAIANRAANGVVQIRANTATAGAAGEVTVAEFQDDRLLLNSLLHILEQSAEGASVKVESTGGRVGIFGTADSAISGGPDFISVGSLSNHTFKILHNGNPKIIVQPTGVALGVLLPATSAKLDIQGTDGALLLPRLTTTQRNALTAANGMVIFNTTLGAVETYAGGAWRSAAHQNQTTVRVAGVAGTAVELLPAGTVSSGAKIQARWTIKPSSGNSRSSSMESSASVDDGSPGGTEVEMYTSITNNVKLRVNANGSVDVRRTAGSLTYELVITMIWL